MPRKTSWAEARGRTTPMNKNPAVLMEILDGLHHDLGPLTKRDLSLAMSISESHVSRASRFHCRRCAQAASLPPTEPCMHVDSLSAEKLHTLATVLWPLDAHFMSGWLRREYNRPPGSKTIRPTLRESAVAAARRRVLSAPSVPL